MASEQLDKGYEACDGNLILRVTSADYYYLVCDKCSAVISILITFSRQQKVLVDLHVTGR